MATLTIRPDGDSAIAWAYTYPASPTTHYTKVDESSVDDTDYNRVIIENENDIFTFQGHTTESGVISNVRIYLRAKNTGDDGQITAVVNGYINAGNSGNLTLSYIDYFWDYATNPATGLAWTWTNIDALLAGVRSQSSYPLADINIYMSWCYVVVTYESIVTLTIQEMLHSQTIDSLNLIQNLTLAIQELLHSQSIDNLVLIQNLTLTINELLHSQTIDNTILTQVHNLTVQEILHSQSIDSLNLIQNLTLIISDLLHSQSIENLDIVITGWLLIINDLLHSQNIEGLNLSQVHNLTVQEMLHSQLMDGLNLTQVHYLIVQELLHSQTIDNLVLIQQYILAISDILHSQSIEGLSLSQIHNLIIQELLHSQSIDLLDLIEKIWAWERRGRGTDAFTKSENGVDTWVRQSDENRVWIKQNNGLQTWIRKTPHKFGDPLE